MTYADYRRARGELVVAARSLGRESTDWTPATAPTPARDRPRGPGDLAAARRSSPSERIAPVGLPRSGADHARGIAPPRGRDLPLTAPAPTRAAPLAAVRTGLRLGAQGADLLAHPGGLKAARLALSVSRTLRTGWPTPQARAVAAALRLGLDGLSFVLRPGPLKAVRIALALSRTALSREHER
jgi:hypothetical protein